MRKIRGQCSSLLFGSVNAEGKIDSFVKLTGGEEKMDKCKKTTPTRVPSLMTEKKGVSIKSTHKISVSNLSQFFPLFKLS